MELWFTESHTPNVKFSIRVDRQLYSSQSEFQRIDVFESPEFGRILVLDGYLMMTEKDEFIYHEMITHVPMAVHPNVKSVLVIGAGDGGVEHGGKGGDGTQTAGEEAHDVISQIQQALGFRLELFFRHEQNTSFLFFLIEYDFSTDIPGKKLLFCKLHTRTVAFP